MRVEDNRLPATCSDTNKLSRLIRRPHTYSGMAWKLTADFWGRQVTPLEQRAIVNNHYFRGRGGGASTTTGDEGNFDTHALTHNGYQRLAEEGSNMSISSTMSVDSTAMSIEESSVGSNNSRTTILMHPDLRRRTMGGDAEVGHSVVRLRNSSSARIENCGKDALADSLMGAYSPTATTAMQGLQDYQDLTIDPRLLNLGPAFAQGAFGKLYRGTYQGQEVAVKILERPESDLERALIMEQQFAQEVRMLATLRHPNVIRFVGCCTRPLAWCIVTEYAKGGSLRSFLTRRQNQAGIPLKMVVKWALDIARGMEYLHSLGFIHRDLKSGNLLIATDKSIKIADFGAARIEVQTEDMTPETGTYRWMAPEMIQHHTYSNKVDVYSFGIVLWELVTGNLPFQNMTAVQAAFAVVNKGLRPTVPPNCPSILAQIMTRCWDANLHERPSFSRVVKLLEEAETQIKTTVGTAIFRCGRCFARPLTFE